MSNEKEINKLINEDKDMEEAKHINEEEIEVLLKAAEELGSKVLSWLKETINPDDFGGKFYVIKDIDNWEISINYPLEYQYDYARWADLHHHYKIKEIDFDSKEAIAKKTEEIKSEEYFRRAKYDAIGFLLDKLAQTYLEVDGD